MKRIHQGAALPALTDGTELFTLYSRAKYTVSGVLSAELKSTDRILVTFLIRLPRMKEPRKLMEVTLSHGDSQTVLFDKITLHGELIIIARTTSGLMRQLDFAFYEE